MRRRRLGVAAAVASVLTAMAVAPSSPSAAGDPVTLPDLEILVPTSLISIGTNSDTGHRQLQFTHITADVGAGPFEIDPYYHPSTGTATFSQAIYRSPSPGTWVLDHHVTLAAVGNWEPPSDYAFPLTRFTLNQRAPDGSPGRVVATSPKVDYCITGDYQLSGIPNTPDQTSPPQGNCSDPTAPLGWSVGWGDEYDQTDAGQPIDLSGVPDGIYVLHATVDPHHIFTESNTTNDVTDTTLRIAGANVTVLAQQRPGTTIPRVSITAPRAGATIVGATTLSATASAGPGAGIRSVQFLLDGAPLGPPITRPPYVFAWSVGSTPAGRHYLSAEATDSDGNLGTARSVPVRLIHGPQLRLESLRWSRGILRFAARPLPAGISVQMRLEFAHGSPRTVHVRGTRITLRTPRPRLVVLRLLEARRPLGSPIAISLSARPAVAFTGPAAGATVTGIVPLSVSASDAAGIASVRFYVAGREIGRPTARPPFAIEWDTRRLHNRAYTISARATNVLGNTARATLRVIVANPAPPMTCFVLQAHVRAHGSGSVTTPAFNTISPGETLLAFVGSDGPQAGAQTATVSGGGLSWRLVKRANASAGDSEIWTAVARTPRRGARVTAVTSAPGYALSLSVVAMEGADGVGAAAAASGPSGPPSLKLRTLSRTSLVFAAGNDWDRAVARTLPPGWVFLDQWLDTGTGDTYWSQYTNQPTGRPGTVVSVRDLAPTGDRWNLVAVELVGSG